MTLKEELELLRGEPIKLKAPVEQVPCNETSDAEKLCKHPVVSVHMLTYNHEPYIAQAIEGVMMQQTDFEFELVIGEDASQDRTREICFEYQKRYPDKIRVLWSEENVTRPYGGNGTRVTARCRGEFIAFCEGDDYWTDPLKLQKQVEVMRANSNVGLCFTAVTNFDEEHGDVRPYAWERAWPRPFIRGRELLKPGKWILTVSAMIRRSVWQEAVRRYEVFSWRLALGDWTVFLGCTALAAAYFLKDVTCVYRTHAGGATSSNDLAVERDAGIVFLYFETVAHGRNPKQTQGMRRLAKVLVRRMRTSTPEQQRQLARGYLEIPSFAGFVTGSLTWRMVMHAALGGQLTPRRLRWANLFNPTDVGRHISVLAGKVRAYVRLCR